MKKTREGSWVHETYDREETQGIWDTTDSVSSEVLTILEGWQDADSSWSWDQVMSNAILLTPEQLNAIFDQLPHLKSIDLSQWEETDSSWSWNQVRSNSDIIWGLTPEQLKTIFDKLPYLKSIDLSQWEETDSSWSWNQVRSNSDIIWGLTPEQLKTIFDQLPDIKPIDLPQLWDLDSEQLKALIIEWQEWDLSRIENMTLEQLRTLYGLKLVFQEMSQMPSTDVPNTEK